MMGRVPPAPKVIYYRFAYSPTSGDVTLSHNHEGHPAQLAYHDAMAAERPEGDLILGYAHRMKNGWRITDADHRPIGDRHIMESVVAEIARHDKPRKQRQSVSGYTRFHYGQAL